MQDLHQCQGTHIHDTMRAAALNADMWRVAQQAPFAVNKPILSPEQGSKGTSYACVLNIYIQRTYSSFGNPYYGSDLCCDDRYKSPEISVALDGYHGSSVKLGRKDLLLC
ncbi:hypothetical protein DUI87_14752 [Hirundo rustica rustica]|uniref:Uncharacterized protein n=1 Tax=Hirundo rustica rustica TaxID=333673 RepID=A0A3M0K5N9_HIRRU|nr:hypothetical protein DUI87_14752 [Hirundo rustica rustica]